jgi:hypothetical protein
MRYYNGVAGTIENHIYCINHHISAAIEDRSIFDEFLNDHIVYYKTEIDEPILYDGRVIECPVYFGNSYFNVNGHFTRKEFDSLKKEFNRLILLDILADIAKLETSMYQNCIVPDSKHKKLFSMFDGTSKIKDSEYVINFIKECNFDVRFLIANLKVYDIIKNNVHFKCRLRSLKNG